MLLHIFVASAFLAQPKQPEGTRYLEIPLKGEFGKEITAPGVRDAIRAAKAKKAQAVVLILDSPGGLVIDAQAIAGVLDKECAASPDLKVYALVTRAISASVWPLSRCDKIFFAPGGAAGAAVAFRWDDRTGSAEVDAKFNAAIAAQVSAAAEKHGQSGAAYRAMILQNATLVGWRDGAGALHLSETAPADAKDIEQIDSPASVLAWSTEQAAKYGFGTMLPAADADGIGPALKLESWQNAGDGGPQAMARCAKDIERKAAETQKAMDFIKECREKVGLAAQRLVDQSKLAAAAAPEKTVRIVYKESSGLFTSETTTRWREATDRAIGEWNTFMAMFADLQTAERRAAKAVDDYNITRGREFQARLVTEKIDPVKLEPVDHGLDLKMLQKMAQDEIARLNANRAKMRL